MKCLHLSLLAIAMVVGFAQQSDAQVVPYRVTGDVSGNLNTGVASGSAVGLHFGQLTFSIDEFGLDVQVAADGSELWLMKVQDLEIRLDVVEGGLLQLYLVDEWEIIGGTGRFANASAVDGNIISTAISEPFADPTNISATFQKVGRINLGNKGKK